jgi:hypothetical protein
MGSRGILGHLHRPLWADEELGLLTPKAALVLGVSLRYTAGTHVAVYAMSLFLLCCLCCLSLTTSGGIFT